MNDETYRTCESCGRPMKICKGQCCGQPQGCGCREYGPMKAGCLREVKPSCPYQAVIPTLTVEDKSNLKDLADCFVHVSNINTTFYIDDKHRTIVTWAGPVEYENYDLDANTLGLRSQFLIDKANDYAAYYDKTGAYQLFNYSEGGSSVMTLDLTYDNESISWQQGGLGPFLAKYYVDEYNVMSFEVPNPSFTDHDTGDEYSLGDVFEMLEGGAEIRFNGIPVNYEGYSSRETGSIEHIILCDNVSLSTKSTFLDPYGNCYSYSGVVFPQAGPLFSPILGIALSKELLYDGRLNRYVLTTQGIYDLINES